MSPEEVARALERLGLKRESHSRRKNYIWLELLDVQGHQIAIADIPTAKNPVPAGTLRKGILQPNGIRDADHLKELLADKDPPGALRKVLPKGGPRYRPSGQ